MEEHKKPLARVSYICKECGADYQKSFELYHQVKEDTKFCSPCRAITWHYRKLPIDDSVMNYQRPNLLPVTRYKPPPRPF